MKEYSPKRRTALVFTRDRHVRRLPRRRPEGARRERREDRPRGRARASGAIAAAFAAVGRRHEALRPGRVLGRRALAGRSTGCARPCDFAACLLGGLVRRLPAAPRPRACSPALLFPLAADRRPRWRRAGHARARSALVGGARGRERTLPRGAGPARLRASPLVALVGLAAALCQATGARFPERFESFLDARPGGCARLGAGLWEVARGPAISRLRPREARARRSVRGRCSPRTWASPASGS